MIREHAENTVISPFTLESYDDVVSLWRKCEGIGLSDADSYANIQAYLQRNPGMSFIATADHRIIGAVLAGHDGRRGYLHHLAVHPAYRCQGLGRRLVEGCLKALQTAGIRKCHIFIFNDNHHGKQFWRNIGWQHRLDIGIVSKNIDAAI